MSPTETTMDHPSRQKRPLEMTLEHAADDLDSDTHDRLNQSVLGEIEGETPPQSYLLTIIVSTSEGKLDSTYIDPIKARTLLQENPALSALEKAWEQKSFNEIRNLSMLCLILPWRMGSNVDTEILRPKQGLCYCWLTRTPT